MYQNGGLSTRLDNICLDYNGTVEVLLVFCNKQIYSKEVMARAICSFYIPSISHYHCVNQRFSSPCHVPTFWIHFRNNSPCLAKQLLIQISTTHCQYLEIIMAQNYDIRCSEYSHHVCCNSNQCQTSLWSSNFVLCTDSSELAGHRECCGYWRN